VCLCVVIFLSCLVAVFLCESGTDVRSRQQRSREELDSFCISSVMVPTRNSCRGVGSVAVCGLYLGYPGTSILRYLGTSVLNQARRIRILGGRFVGVAKLELEPGYLVRYEDTTVPRYDAWGCLGCFASRCALLPYRVICCL
jgi:hypothetical protein